MKNVSQAKIAIMIALILIGVLLSIYAIRLPIKMLGLSIMTCSVSLLILIDDHKLSIMDKALIWATAIITVTSLLSSTFLLTLDGPQPVTDKIHVDPESIRSIKDGISNSSERNNQVDSSGVDILPPPLAN